jgi:copper chaperone NosL
MRKAAFPLALAVMIAGIYTLAQAQADIDTHAACQHCGMDRKMHAYSRMLLVFDDGSEVGTCSLHCVAVDMALNIDKVIKSMKVADYNTKNLIDAEKAIWVIGGSKPGVMSKRAKWALEKKERYTG